MHLLHIHSHFSYVLLTCSRDGLLLGADICNIRFVSSSLLVVSSFLSFSQLLSQHTKFVLLYDQFLHVTVTAHIVVCRSSTRWHYESNKHAGNDRGFLITGDWCGSKMTKQKGRQLIIWKAGKNRRKNTWVARKVLKAAQNKRLSDQLYKIWNVADCDVCNVVITTGILQDWSQCFPVSLYPTVTLILCDDLNAGGVCCAARFNIWMEHLL